MVCSGLHCFPICPVSEQHSLFAPAGTGLKCCRVSYLLVSENTTSTLPWELKAHVTKGFFPPTFSHHVSLLPALQSCHFNAEWIKECMFYYLFHTVQISSLQLPSFIQPQSPSHQRGRISPSSPFCSMAFFGPTAALWLSFGGEESYPGLEKTVWSRSSRFGSWYLKEI